MIDYQRIHHISPTLTKQINACVYQSFFSFNTTSSSPHLIRQYQKKYNPDTGRRLTHHQRKNTPIIWCAFDNEQIIGLIAGSKNTITHCYVTPGYTGQGIGHNLIKLFEQESKAAGSRYIKLKASPYAQQFYYQQGYLPLDTKQHYCIKYFITSTTSFTQLSSGESGSM